jgi:hypothetical protein
MRSHELTTYQDADSRWVRQIGGGGDRRAATLTLVRVLGM